MKHLRKSKRGMALITALVALLIISALLAGILTLTVSQLDLSITRSAYANALSLAEAGVNWEIWKISRDASLRDYEATAPSIQLTAGSRRRFRAWIDPTGWPANQVRPVGEFWVYGEGVVEGVKRTIRIKAKGFTPFEAPTGEWALFGINQLNHLGGSGEITGAVGTNGAININGHPTLDGNFWYGASASGTQVSVVPPNEIYHVDFDFSFHTVNYYARQVALSRYGVTITPDMGLDGQEVNFFAQKIGSMYPYNDNSHIVDAAGNPVQWSAGKPFDLTTQVFSRSARDPVTNKPTLVLPPGNYYLRSLDMSGGGALVVDNRNGPVTIWLGETTVGAGGADTINGNNLTFTTHKIEDFTIYDGKQAELRLNGTMDFWGRIYAYNGPDRRGSYYGRVTIQGDGYIRGSVISYIVNRMSGNAEIYYPSSGGGSDGPSNPGDPIDYFGAVQNWEEVNPL